MGLLIYETKYLVDYGFFKRAVECFSQFPGASGKTGLHYELSPIEFQAAYECWAKYYGLTERLKD